jgi:hypothetical protein
LDDALDGVVMFVEAGEGKRLMPEAALELADSGEEPRELL